MVRTLHANGLEVLLEVLLDVVFNHTAENNDRGATFSYRGLDNPTYYILGSPDAQQYLDLTGVEPNGTPRLIHHDIVGEVPAGQSLHLETVGKRAVQSQIAVAAQRVCCEGATGGRP
jgi:hypothetical protein